jgi:hypothetical protein
MYVRRLLFLKYILIVYYYGLFGRGKRKHSSTFHKEMLYVAVAPLMMVMKILTVEKYIRNNEELNWFV